MPPSSQDQRPTTQSEGTAPGRRRRRTIARRFRAILRRVCRCINPQDNEDTMGPNDVPLPSNDETNILVPSTSVTTSLAFQTAAKTTTDSHITVVPTISESNKSDVAPDSASMKDEDEPTPSSDGHTSVVHIISESNKSEVDESTNGEEVFESLPSTSETSSPHLRAATPFSEEPPSIYHSCQSLVDVPIPSTSCDLSIQHPSTLRLEDFQYYTRLGQGGFGTVLLASHPASKKKLAIKLVQKARLKGYQHFALRELYSLKVCSGSRFITHLYAAFQTQALLVFVMEYLSGGDLSDLIHTSAPFTTHTIRFVTAEILCGLQYIHSMDIVHRDLKPENILLDGDGHVKIADFGLAAGYVSESSRIKGYAGTPGYIAPEVFQNNPYFQTADYFSLGIIIYEMAVGNHPYLADQDAHKCTKEIERDILYKPLILPPGLDYQVADIIKRMLCLDQEERTMQICSLTQHPLFYGLNWNELWAPQPDVEQESCDLYEAELHGFTWSETCEMLSMEDLETPIAPEEQDIFRQFSYVSESLMEQDEGGSCVYRPLDST